ncbi:MAG: glycosyltransferase, partial [Fibrobacter sp.]|nr:glycosyltransferase [Fibrobacter sp.]
MLLLSIPLATYTIFLLILVAAVLKKNNKTDSVFADDISIVIPFRNEQHNLPALLESLKNQIFPGKIEIILVDDQSTDNSVGIVKDLKDQYPHTIVLLSSIFDPSKKMSSKQQALDLGIRSSKNPWIALTDADMQLQPQWLKSLISGISKDSGLVFGHTALLKPTSCFEHAQAFQLEFLFATAYAFYK